MSDEAVRNGLRGAFATPNLSRSDGGMEWGESGLTKREYIATMALQGLCAGNPEATYFNAAFHAVRHADELLKALEETK